jgi:hypothetical protein
MPPRHRYGGHEVCGIQVARSLTHLPETSPHIDHRHADPFKAAGRGTRWHPAVTAILESLGLFLPAFLAGSNDRNPG